MQVKISHIVFLLLLTVNPCNSRHLCSSEENLKNNHPRLILTTENIKEFRTKADGVNQFLYNQALQLANEFSQRPIIEFKNAHNSFREIGDAMPVLGLIYNLNNDGKFVEVAEKWISAMLNTVSWEGSQNLGRSSWVVGLCFLYDWMYDALDEKLKNQLINRLLMEAEIIIETASGTRALSNHLLIETSAVGLVGLVLQNGHEKKQLFLNQANKWTEYIIAHAPQDGSWGEGVQYWQYGIGYFLRFLEASATCGYKDYYNEYEWLSKTGYFPIYFSMPDQLTKVINFSDCGTDRYLPAFLFYLTAKISRNGYFQDFGEKVQSHTPHKFSWLDFLFYDSTLPAVDYKTLTYFKHFTDHGFVSMRSGWEKGSTVVGFRCGPAPGHYNQSNPKRAESKGFGPGHQQPDINNFCIFAQDEWLVIDPGYTKLKETRNHNTILFNEYGQAGAGSKWLDYMEFESREPAPEIIYTESNKKYDYLIGDAGNIYVDEARLEYFRRHLVFLKPDIVIILDDLKTDGLSTFEWLLQLNEITKISLVNNEFKMNKNDVEFWVTPVLPYGVKAVVNERKLDANDVHGLPNYSEGFLKTLKLSEKGEKLMFLTVISILDKRDKHKPEVRFENDILSIKNNGKKWFLKYITDESDPKQPLLKVIDID